MNIGACGEPDALEGARPVRGAGRGNGSAERPTPRPGSTPPLVCLTCPGCGSARSASSPIASWSRSRCAVVVFVARSASSRFTRDFENLVAWLATKTDKTATCRLTRIDWHTIGRVIERVGAELLAAEDRLSDLFEISIDEVAWRKGHRYLTLVGDHRRRCVVWGCEGNGQAAADEFFAALDPLPEEIEQRPDTRPAAQRARPPSRHLHRQLPRRAARDQGA